MPAIKPGTNASFGPLKQINAGVLNVGYAEADPANGPGMVLLHGWPYDIHSFVDVAPMLAQAGYDRSVCAKKFSGPYEHRTVKGGIGRGVWRPQGRPLPRLSSTVARG